MIKKVIEEGRKKKKKKKKKDGEGKNNYSSFHRNANDFCTLYKLLHFKLCAIFANSRLIYCK